MSREKLYVQCPHCGADVHASDDGYCFICGHDMTREPKPGQPTVFPACPEPFERKAPVDPVTGLAYPFEWKCPHCATTNMIESDVDMSHCWQCGMDLSTPPSVMTPDGRREVAITMLDNLYSARTAISYRMGCTSLSIPADKTREQWIEEAQNDYITIQEQILELMGVDS